MNMAAMLGLVQRPEHLVLHLDLVLPHHGRDLVGILPRLEEILVINLACKRYRFIVNSFNRRR